MKAGAATQILRFPEAFFPTEGFSVQLDDLHARVLVMEGESRHALLSLEMTSLPADVIDRLTKLLREKTGAEHCFVVATHTFSAPHFMPDFQLQDEAQRQKKQQLLALVDDAVGHAAQIAADSMVTVQPFLGMATCNVCTNRDVLTPEGWWVSCGGDGPVDPDMTVLRLTDEGGLPVAAMVHYAVQSSVLDGAQLRAGGKAVSGDLAGRMATALEKAWKIPVLFLPGAAGDQAPRHKAVSLLGNAMTCTDLQDDAIPQLEEQALEMADAAQKAMASAKPMATAKLDFARRTITVPAKKMKGLRDLHPTKVPAYEPDGVCEHSFEMLRIGELLLIGVKPELNCLTARQITGGDPLIRVATMWNGASKYMADAASYDRVTYEAQNSPFGRGAAEMLVEAARSLIAQVKRQAQ